ncbi:syntabulin [Rhinolophus ferrumequinum]|uniref:Syntabulin n=1 Tax=Rhinolophus ferrumequinum TaxID=59479 RepID=A0A7J7VFI7_RHIFE|nr:syntabulin [Rhinolophus ferrumequinum]
MKVYGAYLLSSEADFSSSSSTGSISAPEVHMSAAGSKRSSFSRNRGPHGRSNGASSHMSGNSPPSPREKDLLSMLCRNQLSPVTIHPNYAPSSPSSSNSGSYKGSDCSPVMRRSGRYMSCGENHGIKPPNPEQYLTPLQQKEVTVRHLKTKLKESERRLHERETEIVELKSQLARMREDWIEEECHRVEAQLALKEARKEIKQLKQVIETMRSSLADKDKGIQKYFVDINIQNKKLESLLQSMEMAHNGTLRDELCLDFPCDSPEKSFLVDLTPRNPNSAILLSPVETPHTVVGLEAHANRLMRELDFASSTEERWDSIIPLAQGAVGKQYWSSSFLVDLLAVAAPMVPTVLWAFSTQRGGTDPVYNIGALLRGCCVVALHSLRRTAFHIKT